MFPTPNPQRVKTGLDSAEYETIQKWYSDWWEKPKVGNRILGQRVWFRLLMDVKLLTLLHGHDLMQKFDARC